MTLATKNGAIIVKGGKLAESCGCCAQCPGCSGSFSGTADVLCASGALIGNQCVVSWTDQPFNSCALPGSNTIDKLAEGDYPDAVSVFPNAIQFSFDAVAVKDGYVACFYAAKNFAGTPFVVAKGPIVINNSNWYLNSNWSPASGYRSAWSTVNMYGSSSWQRPGSLRICQYDGTSVVPEVGLFE